VRGRARERVVPERLARIPTPCRGLAPTDIGAKTSGNCLIGMQVLNGKFVRVGPVAPGTFDCAPVITLTLDPVKAYKGSAKQSASPQSVGSGLSASMRAIAR